MALCVSLLVGAGLLARSLWAMTDQSLGFEPRGLLTGVVQLPIRDYPTPESRILFRDQFEERLRAFPGVERVATATSLPTAVRQRSGSRRREPPPTGTTVRPHRGGLGRLFSHCWNPASAGPDFDAQDHPTLRRPS